MKSIRKKNAPWVRSNKKGKRIRQQGEDLTAEVRRRICSEERKKRCDLSLHPSLRAREIPKSSQNKFVCDRDLAKKQNYIRDPSTRNHCHDVESSRHGLGRAVITKRLSLIQKMQRGYHKGPKFHCQAKRQQNKSGS